MRVIEYEDIKIETPYKLLSVEEVKMKHDINDHAQIMIKGIIEEEEGYDATINTELQDYIKIYRQGEEEDIIVFKGQIAMVKTLGEGRLYRIEIEGISSSFLLDTKKKSRSFQNVNMTYNELIREVIGDHRDSDFILNVEDRKIENPIIQYEETDWEFLKRLASHFNTVLICDISDNKPRFIFGFAKKNKKEIEDTKFYRASKDLEALKRAERDFHDTDFFYYEIESKEDYEIQDEVWFKQKRLYISKIEVLYSGGIFKYRYRLSRIKGIYTNKRNNDNIKGVAIEGKVIDRKEDKIKLHLKIDKEQNKEDAYWFTYAPLTNNAMYLLPEINTYARLYFPNSKEKDGQAVNSVRKNGDSCSETSNPNIRYLTTKDKNQIKMSPGEVEIKSNKDLPLKLSLNDEKGIEIWSNRDIIVNALKELRIIAGGKIKIIAADQIVLTSKKVPQSISIENEIHILGKIVYLEGRERISYLPFDDAPEACIPEKKASFNWGNLAKNILCGIAVVAAVAAVTVLTFGTGTVAIAAATGAMIVGSIAVMGEGKISEKEKKDKSSSEEAITGAISGAYTGAVEPLVIKKELIAGEKEKGKLEDRVKAEILSGEGISLGYSIFNIDIEKQGTKLKVANKKSENIPTWLENGADRIVGDVAAGEIIGNVPSEYEQYIDKLRKTHPNWTFEFFESPVTWEELIKAQDVKDTNLIETSYPQSYREPDPNNKDGWSPPVKQVIEYYADPRNFLNNEKDLFQFLELGYEKESNRETLQGVKNILENTVHINYGETIMKAAEESKVSSYYLAAKLVAEAGRTGNPLTSGTVENYEGCFNPYNWDASGKTDKEVLRKGAKFANDKGWHSIEAGIVGGAKKLGRDYISIGQDTVYTQKFDIVGEKYFNHQYMQNIAVASLEGPKLYKVYKETGALDANLVFKIPVYSDLPEVRTSLPE
ncbi:contractile injection system protein, VgrG/Pvc8 family [Wukongibacter baidiensis]|uniref:N-acetylglucosaminidase n=1 Tax=Wukongibacter baidiensis TaxID=1723361 RepID=UPI003D7FA38C